MSVERARRGPVSKPGAWRHGGGTLPRACGMTDAHARALIALFDDRSNRARRALGGRALRVSEAFEVLLRMAREGRWSAVEVVYAAYTLGLSDGRAGLVTWRSAWRRGRSWWAHDGVEGG